MMVSRNFDARAHASLYIHRQKDKLPSMTHYNCNRSSHDRPTPERPTPERSPRERPAPERLELTRSRPISPGVQAMSCSLVKPKQKVGDRLYIKALERAKKLEMRQKGSLLEKSPLSSKSLSQEQVTAENSRSAKSTRIRHSFTPQPLRGSKDSARKNRLYGLSKSKQEDGKKRREAIALASKKRNSIPKPEDFGKIPISKAKHMYEKGVEALRKKEKRVAEQHERKLASQNPKQDFGTIPISKASNMYHKGQRVLRQKEEKVLVRQKVLSEKKQRSNKKIPLSRADNMYTKGVQNLIMKELRIAERNKQKIEGEMAQHEFKLAEGAFALNPEFEHARDSEMSTSSYSWMTTDTGLTPIITNISYHGRKSRGQRSHHKMKHSRPTSISICEVPTVIEEPESSNEFEPPQSMPSKAHGDEALDHAKQLVRRAKHQLSSKAKESSHQQCGLPTCEGRDKNYKSFASKLQLSFSNSSVTTPSCSTSSVSSRDSINVTLSSSSVSAQMN